MPVHAYYKILFLPKWYPNRTDKLNGVFIERYAKALVKNCKTAVLFVGSDLSLVTNYEIEITNEQELKVVRIYYRKTAFGNSIIGKAIQFFRYLNASYKGLKIIKAEFGKPNLVHVNVLTRPGLIALLLKLFNSIPYIITEHWSGYMPADGAYKGLLKKAVTKIVVKNATAISTVSKQLETAMKQHGLDGNYATIGNIVETNNLPNATLSSGLNAIMIGNLEDREKNISPVIRAIAELQVEFPDLHLTLVGDGVDKEKLQKLSAELNVLDKITFTGELEHTKVYALLVDSSFLILNSNFETFSVVAAEALACRTPVLSSRCGGPEEFLSDENAKFIPLNNPTELKEGIKWMCSNHSTFNKEKMKKFALDNFSEVQIISKFISIYNPIITSWEAGNTREKIAIPYDWKVLDVGSGDHPNERADVLLEREIEETEHRSGAKAVIPAEKKLVLGDATEMPFATKEFDFVIASHIAEHIDEPEKFCAELQRVAKNGYLETPGAFSEFIFNEPFHKWVVSNKNGTLLFTEKTKHSVFSEFFYRFYYLNEKRTNHSALYSNNIFVITFVNLIRKSWKHLPQTYTRFHWKNSFEYKVIRKSQNG